MTTIEPKPELKRCTRCVMPETWPGITFDEEGVCNICRAYDQKQQINWEEREQVLLKILNEYRMKARLESNPYDCIVGYSGGKDTVYTLWAAVLKYSMKPLVVTFDHGFRLEKEAEWNLMEIPKLLNCDHIRFTLGGKKCQKMMMAGCKLIGDFCIHCHLGVGAFPAHISRMFKIPLQIWGEPTAEYQTVGNKYDMQGFEEQNREHFISAFQNGMTPQKICSVNPGYPKTYDLKYLDWPDEEFPLKAIYLGNYEPWNQRDNVKIITDQLGWKHIQREDSYVDWDKSDCPYEPVRGFQKYMKRGFGRATFQASKDIREGYITREQGMLVVNKLDSRIPTGLLVKFANETGLSVNDLRPKTHGW